MSKELNSRDIESRVSHIQDLIKELSDDLDSHETYAWLTISNVDEVLVGCSNKLLQFRLGTWR